MYLNVREFLASRIQPLGRIWRNRTLREVTPDCQYDIGLADVSAFSR